VNRRFALAVVALFSCLFGACANLVGIYDVTLTDAADASNGADGSVETSADTALEAPSSGFSLAASPSFVVMDPGDAPVTIQVEVARAASFNGVVTLTVTGGSTDAVPSAPADIASTSTTSSFTLTLSAQSTARGDFMYVVHGASGALTAQASFTLHIGSLLTPDDGGVISASAPIIVKAWGAGGGESACNAIGGGGGFASAQFDLTSATSLVVVEGTGGGGAPSQANINGAGGGGFSGIKVGTTWMLIAGGGGGGGGSPGAGGGGGTGQSAQISSCYGGGGGTQTSGGAIFKCNSGDDPGQAGSALVGGAGADFGSGGAGGAPGGGVGGLGQDPNCGGGGGGSGWFGGAGSSFNGNAGGGGGGSGYVSGGFNQNLVTATNQFAANATDPDYNGTAGLGGQGSNPNGASGLVVVRLVKP
jgi:hypothetical protein